VEADRMIQTGRKSSRRVADHMAALGEMTGGITHDFRNILAVIDAGVSVAERHANEPDQVRLCLAGVHEGVKRGLNLTSRLLGFAKEQDRALQPRDLNELLQQLRVFLQYGAGPDVRIVFDLAPALPSCVLDAAEFNAAVLNLVVNARDAMPGGGAITIKTSVEAEPPNAAGSSRTLVHLRVSDTGQGMSPAVLRKVFDRYFTTKGEAGTGLGVPQVCAFVQRVGGRINLKSAVGVGTTFDLAFPIQIEAAPTRNLVWRQVDRWINEGGAGEEAIRNPLGRDGIKTPVLPETGAPDSCR
jgi:signal transduction histidine kinase